MDPVQLYASNARAFVNNIFVNKDPFQIVTITATTVLASVWLWEFLFQEESLKKRLKKATFKLARRIPYVANEIKKEMKKLNEVLEKDVVNRTQGAAYITNLPQRGRSNEEIINEVELNLSLGDYDWSKGFVSGAVYNFDPELIKLLTQVYGLASYTNPLHPDIFPGVCKMEAEVVRMTANLFHGGPDACGTMTTGGTESILMACKAYRDYAIEVRGIKSPEIVLPITAHPAFDKAAAYFKIRIRHIPVDPNTTKVDIKAMKRAIGSSTCMLVGSAPNYPYGTMDDIKEIAALGVKYNVPVHVDACLGGFVIAFMDRAGFSLPPFDFRLPGVTSMSADTHKYGFAPKGSSLVLYSDPKYRHHQFCVSTDWPGGVYGSPGVSGSRAGGIIAACWATLLHFGLEGYVDAVKKIVSTTKFIEKGLREMDGIFVFGSPVSSVVAIGSNEFHIYRLSDALGNKGWNLNPLQFPPGIHLCVTYMHTMDGVAERFLSDVREVLQVILQDPKKEVDGKLAMYGMSQTIVDRSLVGELTCYFLDSMYYTPRKQEPTNHKVLSNGS